MRPRAVGALEDWVCIYALSVEQYSITNILWFNIFRVPPNSSMYTKTDRFFV